MTWWTYDQMSIMDCGVWRSFLLTIRYLLETSTSSHFDSTSIGLLGGSIPSIGTGLTLNHVQTDCR
jgi:hypothetical protein